MRTENLRNSLLQVEVQPGNMYLFSADYMISTGNKVSPCSHKAHGLNGKIDVKESHKCLAQLWEIRKKKLDIVIWKKIFIKYNNILNTLPLIFILKGFNASDFLCFPGLLEVDGVWTFQIKEMFQYRFITYYVFFPWKGSLSGREFRTKELENIY